MKRGKYIKPRRAWLLPILVLTVFLRAPTWAVESKPAAVAAPRVSLKDALRNAVVSTRPKLGALQPWQQLLFTSEILPFAESFIREYRLQGAGYQVDVDEQMIRNYLAFFGPKALGSEKPSLLARVEHEGGCDFCSEAAPSMKPLLEARFSARGISIIWVKDGELSSKVKPSKPGEMPSVLQLQAIQASRGASGILVLRVERATRKDDESGLEIQSEDRKFRLVFALSAGAFSEARSVEFTPLDSTEASSRKLVLEAMSSLGEKALAMEARAPGHASAPRESEALLRVSGVQDYFSLLQLKNQAQVALGALNPVMERRLGRGSSTLAIRTKLTGAELKAKLSGLSLGNSKLFVREILVGELGVELEADIQ